MKLLHLTYSVKTTEKPARGLVYADESGVRWEIMSNAETPGNA
ncbi:hypothetical protein FHT29_006583 [Rhizobium sp. SG741]|nr:hypothetical protein [Rhizobium sp. SG741]NRP87042.1 hypothetical protein [Ensifer adhaerens]